MSKPQSTIKDGDSFLNAEDVLREVFPSASSRPSVSWLRKLKREGKVKSYKISGLVFYKAADLRAAMVPKDAKAARLMRKDEHWAVHATIKDPREKRAYYEDNIQGKPDFA